MIVQILILIITFISYVLIRKLKDNGSTASNVKNTENPWQQKIYRKKIIKTIVDLFIAKKRNKRIQKNTTIFKGCSITFKNGMAIHKQNCIINTNICRFNYCIYSITCFSY